MDRAFIHHKRFRGSVMNPPGRIYGWFEETYYGTPVPSQGMHPAFGVNEDGWVVSSQSSPGRSPVGPSAHPDSTVPLTPLDGDARRYPSVSSPLFGVPGYRSALSPMPNDGGDLDEAAQPLAAMSQSDNFVASSASADVGASLPNDGGNIEEAARPLAAMSQSDNFVASSSSAAVGASLPNSAQPASIVQRGAVLNRPERRAAAASPGVSSDNIRAVGTQALMQPLPLAGWPDDPKRVLRGRPADDETREPNPRIPILTDHDRKCLDDLDAFTRDPLTGEMITDVSSESLQADIETRFMPEWTWNLVTHIELTGKFKQFSAAARWCAFRAQSYILPAGVIVDSTTPVLTLCARAYLLRYRNSEMRLTVDRKYGVEPVVGPEVTPDELQEVSKYCPRCGCQKVRLTRVKRARDQGSTGVHPKVAATAYVPHLTCDVDSIPNRETRQKWQDIRAQLNDFIFHVAFWLATKSGADTAMMQHVRNVLRRGHWDRRRVRTHGSSINLAEDESD